ncbi:hypothetical protein [Porcipelethomonas sp.]|uniref:hypothetical protein n=1 Tax=Porcipelethomonas sp. TaxID=2981675 RepID=UPI003EF7B347
MSNYKGVKFGDKHTSDYGIILSHKSIDAPAPKTETVDIPGADGSIDMTEYFGDVKYKNRKLKFEFSTSKSGGELLETYSAMLGDLHGRHFDSIILDDDPDYKYTGRVTNITLTENSGISGIAVECDCEPYKLSVTLNSVDVAVGNSDGKTIDFGTRKITASIHVPDSVPVWTLYIDGESYGKYSVTDTDFAVKGSCNIVIIPYEISVTSNATISYPLSKL